MCLESCQHILGFHVLHKRVYKTAVGALTSVEHNSAGGNEVWQCKHLLVGPVERSELLGDV